jgi:hypothetical protein
MAMVVVVVVVVVGARATGSCRTRRTRRSARHWRSILRSDTGTFGRHGTPATPSGVTAAAHTTSTCFALRRGVRGRGRLLAALQGRSAAGREPWLSDSRTCQGRTRRHWCVHDLLFIPGALRAACFYSWNLSPRRRRSGGRAQALHGVDGLPILVTAQGQAAHGHRLREEGSQAWVWEEEEEEVKAAATAVVAQQAAEEEAAR